MTPGDNDSAQAEWEQQYHDAALRHRRQNGRMTADFAARLSPFSAIRGALAVADEVLEIGCGTGEFADWLARAFGSRVTGIDLAPSAIALARADYGHRVKFLPFDYRDLLVSGNHYDLVVAVSVLEHYQDYEAVLADWFAMAPRVFVIVPYGEPHRTGAYTEGGLRHRSGFTKGSFDPWRVADSLVFETAAWTCGPEPRKWAVLLERDE